MSEPTTKAGQKMLYDMGLDDPIIGKGRHDYAVKRIRAIEAEARAGSLDDAWAEAEAALPPENDHSGPWEIGHLIRDEDDSWAARAQEVIGGGTLDIVDAIGPTPIAALRALAAKLRSG